jgi:hypothetical protein
MRQLMILTVVLGVAGCAATDLIDRVAGSNISETSVQATARTVDQYCLLHGGNVAERSSTLQRINERTTVGDVIAFDCDSDGAPDFPGDSGPEGGPAH